MVVALLLAAALLVAYTNGANDNFKGVATLYGSGTASYRGALGWATVTTFAGSLCSLLLASRLVRTFSAKGLVPDAVAGSPEFLAAVAIGAGATVLLATQLGFPISTTHALTGGLVGAGLVSSGMAVSFAELGKSFFLPLTVSPFLALAAAAVLYPAMRSLRIRLGIDKHWCVCVGDQERLIPIVNPTGALAVVASTPVGIDVDQVDTCVQRYQGRFFGASAQAILDVAHYASAGAVSFARGLNDTPKIVGLLVALNLFDIRIGLGSIAIAMALGGVLQARRVAETVGKKITAMNHGQGFVANVVTAFLVIVASRFGVPVSTTHVSCGSLFGMGLVTGQAHTAVIRQVVLSWVLTLPIACGLAAMTALLLR